MTEENNSAGTVTYSAPMMAAVSLFPVVKPKSGYIEKTNGDITVTLTPHKPDNWVYGKNPRLLFLYIQKLITMRDLCVDFENRTIEFNDSFSGVCRKAGISVAGRRIQEMEDVLRGLAGMTITVTRKEKSGNGIHEITDACVIAEHVETWHDNENEDAVASIRFSPDFWQELVASSIPVDQNVITSFGRSVRAIDIYLWLNYRTYQLKTPFRVSWGQLYRQFEASGMEAKKFHQQFKHALQRVLDACPRMDATLDGQGLTVRPVKRIVEVKADTETTVEG